MVSNSFHWVCSKAMLIHLCYRCCSTQKPQCLWMCGRSAGLCAPVRGILNPRSSSGRPHSGVYIGLITPHRVRTKSVLACPVLLYLSAETQIWRIYLFGILELDQVLQTSEARPPLGVELKLLECQASSLRADQEGLHVGSRRFGLRLYPSCSF